MRTSILAEETTQQAVKRFSQNIMRQGYKYEAMHEYTDLNGRIIYYRIRLKNPNGKKWIRPMHKSSSGKYQLSEPSEIADTLKPLYGLVLINKHSNATIIIVEGEKPADELNKFLTKYDVNSKYVAITSGSATSAEKADWSPLAEKKCIVWPDKNEIGKHYASKVVTILMSLRCKIECIESNELDLPDGGDCVDWIQKNINSDINDLLAIPRTEVTTSENQSLGNKISNQATRLISFIMERSVLFHDKNKNVFASDRQSKEVRQIEGRQFRDYLTASFYEHEGCSVNDKSLREALSTLSGIGRHNSECRTIHRRVAKHEDCYYLDLCQVGNSRTVKISSGYWEIIDSPPVSFIRSETMQPLPNPTQGGNLSLLWQVCNIPQNAQLLTITFLADMLRPDTPYPILELIGEQGTAKSTTQIALRRIIDPNACDLRTAPKHSEDLFVSAGINHVVSYENVSHLSAAMQDALCIIATGGGYAKRKLYSDADESIIYAKNPVIINGITPSITAQDLIDRTITIELPVIVNRIEITTLLLLFEREHGVILGALLDIVAKSLLKLTNMCFPLENRPRLLEFANFGIAIAETMDVKGEEFIQQFTESRQESIARTIDASPIATALIEWFEANGKVTKELPAKTLFCEVEKYRTAGTDAWPRSAKGFADALRRVTPALRQLNIECQCMGKQGSNVRWKIAHKEN